MREYELVVLLHPDLEIDADTPIAKVEKLVSSAGGKITKRDNWGKKRLAYPVKKQLFGIYVYFELELEPTAVREFESQLLITEEVIRFLIVSKLVLQRPKNAAAKATKQDRPAATVKE